MQSKLLTHSKCNLDCDIISGYLDCGGCRVGFKSLDRRLVKKLVKRHVKSSDIHLIIFHSFVITAILFSKKIYRFEMVESFTVDGMVLAKQTYKMLVA